MCVARRASEEERGENRKDRLDEDSAGTKTSLLLPRSEKRGRYIGVSLPRPRPLFSPTSRARRISGREGRRRYGRGERRGRNRERRGPYGRDRAKSTGPDLILERSGVLLHRYCYIPSLALRENNVLIFLGILSAIFRSPRRYNDDQTVLK